MNLLYDMFKNLKMNCRYIIFVRCFPKNILGLVHTKDFIVKLLRQYRTVVKKEKK